LLHETPSHPTAKASAKSSQHSKIFLVKIILKVRMRRIVPVGAMRVDLLHFDRQTEYAFVNKRG